ncbi:hypothetical protein HNQ92_004801 [Rhabdobacter roseus]|uniref:WG repeat-containing protein n=1 Tax=Rhabdobacter roseus TaxID=1655419 RepID=A0A840U3E8_9BACT|nr:WG repeat-containing protein [Rhabdobacter roseus]MBB5286640.1 hypothetical protein [Rhabdobacter roseus]
MRTFLPLILLWIFAHKYPVLAQANEKTDKPQWLKNYRDYYQQGEVYIVKITNDFCNTYQTYLLDKNGKALTPAYRDIGRFSNGLAEFVPFENSNGLLNVHGYINKRGEIVIPPIYYAASRFRDGMAWVIYKGEMQYGLKYLDTTGKEIYKVPVELFAHDFQIDKAIPSHACNYDCDEDLMWPKDGHLWTLYWVPSRYTEEEIKKSRGRYTLHYKGKFGFIDKRYFVRTPVVLDEIDPAGTFSGEGLERVRYGDRYGFVDQTTGEVVIPFLYESTHKPTLGLFWVKKDGKWGCINRRGETVIPFKYDAAAPFTNDNRASVAIAGRFGHIDTTGRQTTPLHYEFASYFNHGAALVRQNGKYRYLDTEGRPITDRKFTLAEPFEKEYATAEQYGLYYTVTPQGAVRFSGISYLWKGFLILVGLGLVVFWRKRVY